MGALQLAGCPESEVWIRGGGALNPGSRRGLNGKHPLNFKAPSKPPVKGKLKPLLVFSEPWYAPAINLNMRLQHMRAQAKVHGFRGNTLQYITPVSIHSVCISHPEFLDITPFGKIILDLQFHSGSEVYMVPSWVLQDPPPWPETPSPRILAPTVPPPPRPPELAPRHPGTPTPRTSQPATNPKLTLSQP